jgi:methionyl-tRNA formyltransferase
MLDLYLGSDLGTWVLDKISTIQIGQVFTIDRQIASRARALGIDVHLTNVNLIHDLIPSKNALSVHYPIIIKPHVIAKYQKMYNLHPGYLPWGRGYYPIFWALWEDTPAGATLHEINEGIDEGNIVDLIQVYYYPHDTGGSLFHRVRKAEKELFLKYWNQIAQGIDIPSYPQQGEGTYHKKKDFLEIKKNINLQDISGKDLIKLIRCLTFEGYDGLELQLGKRTFEASLRILK